MKHTEKKDDRYKFAKTLIEEDKVQTIEDLFKVVPRKIMAKDLGFNAANFSNRKSKYPGNFKLIELIALSKLLDVNIMLIIKILINSMSL